MEKVIKMMMDFFSSHKKVTKEVLFYTLSFTVFISYMKLIKTVLILLFLRLLFNFKGIFYYIIR